jgi:hypothetical protein
MSASALQVLLRERLGAVDAARVQAKLWIDPALDASPAAPLPRRTVVCALNALLFADLLARVPSGAAYVETQFAAGRRIVFDHGALRTVRLPAGPTGALPPGEAAISRVLEPLGYARVGHYPLPRLRMNGYAYAQLDAPETLPQFFVSALEVAELSAAAQAVAVRVFGSSRDPLDTAAQALLARLAATGEASLEQVRAGLPGLLAAFGRSHAPPTHADYEALRAESVEAAWIATEGQVLNHVTDRVADLAATAEAERQAGRSVKAHIEVSSAGSVRQTALLADRVQRRFADGVEAWVPGSFFEFIQRDVIPQPDGRLALDLRFDSGNAQGIFKMTAGR